MMSATLRFKTASSPGNIKHKPQRKIKIKFVHLKLKDSWSFETRSCQETPIRKGTRAGHAILNLGRTDKGQIPRGTGTSPYPTGQTDLVKGSSSSQAAAGQRGTLSETWTLGATAPQAGGRVTSTRDRRAGMTSHTGNQCQQVRSWVQLVRDEV